MADYILPNSISNGDALDATPVDTNFDYIINALNSYDGSKIQAGTIADASLATNPTTVRNEIFGSFVVSGLGMTPTTGFTNLTGIFADGVAYIDGVRVSVTGESKTFTASKDTYVDVDVNGAFHYQEVGVDVTEPTLTNNSTRIAKVTTDGTKVLEYIDRKNANPLATSDEDNSFKNTYIGSNLYHLGRGTVASTLDLVQFDYDASVTNSVWAVSVDCLSVIAGGADVTKFYGWVKLSGGTWTSDLNQYTDTDETTSLTGAGLSLVTSGNDRILRLTNNMNYSRTLADVKVVYRSSNGTTDWSFK